MAEKLLNIDEVAATLNVSRRTVYRLIAEGKIRALKIRGSTRVHPSNLDLYVRRAAEVNQ